MTAILHTMEGLAALVVAVGVIVGWMTTRMSQALKGQLRTLQQDLGNRLGSLDTKLAGEQSNIRVLGMVLSHLLPVMAVKEGMTLDVSLWQSSLVTIVTQATGREESLHNPLSEEELARLRHYRDLMAQGQPLSVDQAQEMNAFAQRMDAEHPDDPIFTAMLIAAAFVLTVTLVNAQNAPHTGGKKFPEDSPGSTSR